MWLRGLERLRHDRVRRRLLRDDDSAEVIIDEVHHHWVVYLLPMLEIALALAVGWVMLVSSAQDGWLYLLVMFGIAGHAAWTSFVRFMDVFVITDMRVFRVSGVFTSKYASTPLSRILDITVQQPTLGLLLRYGHFTFESAAQEQGLRDIRYVGRPLDRDQVIQGQQMRLLRKQRGDRRP